jgi:hypothetical protein
MTKQDIVSYHACIAMKELGFNEPCITSYDVDGQLRNPFDYKNSEYDKPGKNQYFIDCEHMVFNSTLKNNFIAAPLWSQAFRWFVDEFGEYEKMSAHDTSHNVRVIHSLIDRAKEIQRNTEIHSKNTL